MVLPFPSVFEIQAVAYHKRIVSLYPAIVLLHYSNIRDRSEDMPRAVSLRSSHFGISNQVRFLLRLL